jgi:hypothetical protein
MWHVFNRADLKVNAEMEKTRQAARFLRDIEVWD